MSPMYIDFLLIERQDGSSVLAAAKANTADVGYVVEFNNGELGRVKQKAWGGEADGELFAIIATLVDCYEVNAAYWQSWKQEVNNAEATVNS